MTFSRTSGTPVLESFSFAADPSAEYILRISDNGTQGANAQLWLNDAEVPLGVAGQSEYQSEIPVRLSAGNVIAARLTGKPGSTLTVSISRVRPPLPSWCEARLDFDGGSLPAPWSVQLVRPASGTGDGGLFNDRLEARPVDQGGLVLASEARAGGVRELVVEYDGLYSRAYPSSWHGIDLLTAGKTLTFSAGAPFAEPTAHVYAATQEADGGMQGRYLGTQVVPRFVRFYSTYSAHRTRLVFTDGNVRVSIVRLEDGAVMLENEDFALPSLLVQEVQGVALYAYTNSGAIMWVDNATISCR